MITLNIQTQINMKKIIFLAVIVFSFTACKPKGWTESQKEQTKKGCLDGLAGKVDNDFASQYCSCMLDKVIKKYPSYSDLDKKGTNAEGKEIGLSCIAELKLVPKPANDDSMSDSTKQ